MLSKGELIPAFTLGDYKQTDISLFTADEVFYIKERLCAETNQFLVARYAHILFTKTRNNQYAQKALMAYNFLAEEYFHKPVTEEKNIFDFTEIIKAYAALSFAVKYNIEICRNTITGWYQQPDQQLFYYQSFFEIFAGFKLFKKEHLTGFTSAALNRPDSTVPSFDAERYLQACLLVAKKEGCSLLPIYVNMAENQYGLAEQEKHNVSPGSAADHYLSAAKYFKAAKEFTESNKTLRLADA